jgi:hypothetical protein
VGQFHFAQGKGLDLRAAGFEHMRQHVENWRQVPIPGSGAIQDYHLLLRHANSSKLNV